MMKSYLFAAALAATATLSHGAVLQFTASPANFTTGSINVGVPTAGPIAQDPTQSDRLYVAVGSFGSQTVLRVSKATGTTVTVTPPLGSIGGLAVFANGDLAIVENFTSQTILRARDGNSDNDFLDPGEITNLISPIAADGPFGFSGAQAKVAPAGNPSSIPTGSLLVQTADGGTSSELLAMTGPTSGSPAFLPAGDVFFGGFQYNGGFGFDNSGAIILGASEFPTGGSIFGLVNTNADGRITSGAESKVLLSGATLSNGITDLAVTADRRVIFSENSGNLRVFALPSNLLTGSAGSVTTFASITSAYVSALALDDPSRPFVVGGAAPRARLFITGYDVAFNNTTNVLWLEPNATAAAVSEWSLYE